MTGRTTLNDSDFTQHVLPDYQMAHPEETADWDVIYDGRGHFTEPHTDVTVSLSTLDIRRYIGERPALRPAVAFDIDVGFPTHGPENRYRNVLFIEKEGFDPLVGSGAHPTAFRHLPDVDQGDVDRRRAQADRLADGAGRQDPRGARFRHQRVLDLRHTGGTLARGQTHLSMGSRASGLAMTRKKRADGGKKATIVVANVADDLKGALKHLGGSRSDDWNNILANQAINTLWLKHSDEETRDQQYDATLFALIGIGPRDELEGMIAAQLLAAHNAAMECYRRAMLAEQTFEARRENLSQANKLSRTYAALLDALNRHRGKGQQKVTVEHVHVHSGGQAIVGPVAPGRRGITEGELDAVRGIAYEPSTPMRSPDPEREPVPIAGGARKTAL